MHSIKINSPITVVVFLAVTLIAIIMTATISTSVSAQVPPVTPAAGSTPEQRLAQRKAERNVVLAEEDSQRLVNSCKEAQTKIRELQTKVTESNSKRKDNHQKIDAKIWITIGKLKLASVDTFPLEKHRATLAAKTEAVELTAENYRQTLGDMLVHNCSGDVIGFKALLETSRIYLTQLRDQLNDRTKYVTGDVKNSLKEYADKQKNKTLTETGR